MSRAIRAVTVERGRDPRDLTLVAIGGNGGMHAPDVARDLGISRVVVPPLAGVFSAVGMLASDLEHIALDTVTRPLDELTARRLDRMKQGLAGAGGATAGGRRLQGRARRAELGGGPAPRGPGDRADRALRRRRPRRDGGPLRRRIPQDLRLRDESPIELVKLRVSAEACASSGSTSSSWRIEPAPARRPRARAPSTSPAAPPPSIPRSCRAPPVRPRPAAVRW